MQTARNIAVLMYHHVTPQGGSLAVTASRFDHQIRGLARAGFHSLSADEFAAFLEGAPTPKKSVLITFDDGYLDNWVYAHPVLQRYGMRAILFAATGLIGQGRARPFQGQGTPLPACLPHSQAQALMFGTNADAVMLRWDEIHAMVDAQTFEIHSHTHRHQRWDRQHDTSAAALESLRTDLQHSRQKLIDELGWTSKHLCWPQGYFDADYQRIARQEGFQYLYTTDARGQNAPHGDPAHIYRIAVRNRPDPWLRMRIWLANHPVAGPLYNRWKTRGDSAKGHP